MKKLLSLMVIGLISFASYSYCRLTGTFTGRSGERYSFSITANGSGSNSGDCSAARAYLSGLIHNF
jgi:hypothetical protein